MRQYKKPLFQKRHYETIVKFLKSQPIKEYGSLSYAYLVLTLMDLFKADNPNFNSSKFLEVLIKGDQ